MITKTIAYETKASILIKINQCVTKINAYEAKSSILKALKHPRVFYGTLWMVRAGFLRIRKHVKL